MSDERTAILEQRVSGIEAQLAENTRLTREVLDTLRAFKMIGTLAKWAAAVGGVIIGVYHGAQAVFHLGGK